MSVASVVRTDHVRYVGLGDEWPGDPQQFVLLLMKVDGLSKQAFDSLPARDVYLAADSARFQLKVIGFTLSVSSSGTSAGGSVELLAGVPRATRRFTLHLGAHPPLDVVVSDSTIRPEVRRPE